MTNNSAALLQVNLTRLKWTQRFQLGRILSISFCVEDAAFQRHPDHEEVVLVDFTVSSEGGQCGLVSGRAGTLTQLVAGPSGPWSFLEAHPRLAVILLASPGGQLVCYNHLTNEKVGEAQLQLGEELTVIKYSSDGSNIAVGTR
jgi:hypothetical protein